MLSLSLVKHYRISNIRLWPFQVKCSHGYVSLSSHHALQSVLLISVGPEEFNNFLLVVIQLQNITVPDSCLKFVNMEGVHIKIMMQLTWTWNQYFIYNFFILRIYMRAVCIFHQKRNLKDIYNLSCTKALASILMQVYNVSI